MRLIQDHLIQGLSPGREPVQIGGLLALFHAYDATVWVNQAMPVDEVSNADLDAMIAEYESRQRKPWFEFCVDLWPEAARLMLGKGLVCDHQMPIMALRRSEWSNMPTAAVAPKRSQMAECNHVGEVVYGGGPTPEGTDDRVWAAIQSGRVLASVAVVDGQVVSIGQAVGTTTVREVAGLGTLKEHRKNGHCTAVVRHLLNEHFVAGGEIAWLTPGDGTAERLYAEIGFRKIGTQVTYGPPGSKYQLPDEV